MALDESELKMLSELKRKRGVVKASLTRISTFLSKFDPSVHATSQLDFRQEELPLISRKFDTIQCEIELLTTDDTDAAEAEREKFESEYFELRSKIQEMVNADRSHNTTGQNTSFGNTSNKQHMQLAPIPLPKFNGDIQGWSSFYDVFRAMVHDDDSFSPAQKFYYLRSCLSEQALDLVQSIPISDGNYEVVLEKLRQRYDNESLVIQSHVRSILDTPVIEESSAKALQKLHSHVSTHVAALRALGQPVDQWDAWLITIVTSRLDKCTGHSWQLHLRNTHLPKYNQLEEFVASRCVALESSEACKRATTISSEPQYRDSISKKAGSLNSHPKKVLLAAGNNTQRSQQRPCSCCAEMHTLFSCERFKSLSLTARLALVRQARLCFNCLSPFHNADSCKSSYTCKRCNKKHNTLLHFEKTEEKQPQIENRQAVIDEAPTGNTAPASLLVESSQPHVFLPTAVVLATDNTGKRRECRAILDSGSQINFISGSLANRLQLKGKSSILPISGIGASKVRTLSYVEVHIHSRLSNYSMNLVCYVLPTIVAQLQSCATPTDGWQISDDLYSRLADPYFYKAGSIDLLIGGGAFFDVTSTSSARKPLNNQGIFLNDSKFGWIVTGELGVTCLTGTLSVGESLEEIWKANMEPDFSQYGKLTKSNQQCIEEEETVNYFNQTTLRNNEGRFVVHLPRKSTVHELGATHAMATSRFLSVERRLQQDEDLRIGYTEFMKEYIELGHMQEVLDENIIPTPSFYLPHHAVIKKSSLTTKIRVVFDASAKSSSGLSLNSVLKCGPTVQEDVFGILARFRKHQYVVTADVEKMFRQVRVTDEDWDLQRILWRPDPSEPLRTYRLTTVTYGTTPASFLATQCLVFLAMEFKHQYPRAAYSILHDFYMDDLMTGADTKEECYNLQQEIRTILDSAKFPLRKWCCNSLEVLEQMGNRENDPLFTLPFGDEDTIKSLGLEWKPRMDQFCFTISPTSWKSNLTKRTILSDLNRIFDPLGFLSPVLIKGKIFLQQMWATKMDWDTLLPPNMATKWIEFYHSLDQLRDCEIPRRVIPSPADKYEMHGFCDASEEAFGACIYVRSRDEDGQWHSRLLCSKTRVAPLKGATIPRLELNGALLLAELVQKIVKSWSIDGHEVKLWTDSMVVLSWLNNQGTRLKTYVQNRVEQILESTKVNQWDHVSSEENPADMISRGIPAVALKTATLWWHGPDWLVVESSAWKKSKNFIPEQELPEQRKIKLALVAAITPLNKLIKHYSSWRRLLNAVAWLARFVSYIKSKKIANHPSYLTVPELRTAEINVLRQIQRESFFFEVTDLEREREVSNKSKLKRLAPFLCNGLILVGGRLQNSNLTMRQKHPIVLPADHKVTRLIFEDRHRKLLHCGPQALLAEIRQSYWPIKGRLISRSVTLRCTRCFKAKPQFIYPQMGQLPSSRVQVSRPFAITGVDFAGPITIRSGIRRVVGIKAWISLFICFSTRAVHLEVVEDLSTNAFLAALRRFMSRRGRCTKLYSDNGTNFVGAQKILNEPISKTIPILAKEGVEWHFNPPSGPHFGGLWESAVKSAKHHLTRMMGETKLTLGELNTLLCQIEACLNSRPMTPLGSDPAEPEALTPAHFLIGGPINLPEEEELTKENPGGMRRWKYVQYLTQTFWQRWYKEYLPQHQVRGKWTSKKRSLNINDVVIVKDELMPPTRWKLARVIRVHPGPDGVVRVVTIRLASGSEMKRPSVKLCLLPTEDQYTGPNSTEVETK